jgi:cell division protein FtsB
MTADELNALINDLKSANAAQAAQLTELKARTVITEQQVADLKAEIANAVNLAAGK